MEKIFTFMFVLSITIFLYPQTPCTDCPPNSSNPGGYDVITLDSRTSQFDFVPGQVLVKFKDEVHLVLGKSNGYVTVGLPTVDAIMQKYKVTAADRVFPQETKMIEKQFLKSFNGYEYEVPSLHNIHKLQSNSTTNIYEIIRELNEDENVVYAEPNYIFSIIDGEPLSPALTEEEMIEWLKDNPLSTHTPIHSFSQTSTLPASTNVVTPNDPLYSQQWGIPATQINQVWDTVTGDTTQIIAILDTGVDWLHPDLQNKIWRNPGEIEGNGQDNDGNGFIDDVRGWDFINNDNNPMDDNSHGTHVAGIAAADANNGIGIAGVNWGAKIMPVKVFQSSGRGDAATITQGILYAKNNGATVINMSFGSYARSLTMENALANAYATAVLVAAAGNDGRCIGPGIICARFYPAAISYVIGIEATTIDGGRAGFSNVDQDGPVYSLYEELNNYELKAPGSNIISLIPNGGYRVYNGTSMAAPLVSGAVALYRKQLPSHSQELMWGNLINTTSDHLRLSDAMSAQIKPVLWFVSHTIVDTLDGDRDGRPDAGETIEIWFEVRNTWGQADSVWAGIEFGEFEDTTTATIIKDKAFIGSISPYARRTNEFNPLKIKINSNVAHSRDIVFESKLWNSGSNDTVRQQILITIENGDELAGVMDSVMTLTPDKYWIVKQSFRVGVNGTLIIKPGTQLEMDIYIVNRGKIIASGTPDSTIIIKRGGFRGTGQFSFEYTSFQGNEYGFGELETYAYYNPYYFDNCIFEDIQYPNIWIGSLFLGTGFIFNDCIFRSSSFSLFNYYGSPILERCTFEDIYTAGIYTSYLDNMPGSHNNFVKMYSYAGNAAIWGPRTDVTGRGNNFLSFGENSYGVIANGSQEVINMPEQYWGTTEINKIGKKIFDFFDNPNHPMVNIYPFLTTPSDSAHGIVWKVLVNGKDAQDEYVDPLGVGKHRFDVYFNRPMDTDYTPQLTFGVRAPYTQQAVVDSAFWSPDSMIWTAYHIVKLYTGDGINRIRVEGARDTEGFEIPVEDMRFEFLIDAAGSASADFQATAGLGKVNLEWSNPDPTDVPDLLGYNMYRLEHINDTTLTEPIMINTSLINDTLFTDFNVIPNKKYYYYYRVVRTDFSESDSSKVVSSIPFTAAIGDANGDLTINILDITSIVSYLLNQNPQPFIYEAADVNQDGQINILDVVGVVNIIMGDVPKFAEVTGKPKISFDSKAAYIENGEGLAGLQFKLVGENISQSSLVIGEAAKGMESSYNIIGDTMYVVVFSFKNQTMSNSNKIMLFRLTDGYFTELKQITGSNAMGGKVEIELLNDGEIIPKDYMLYQNYPNPFNPSTTIRYALPKVEDVDIIIYDILGQKVWDYRVMQQQPGYYEITWNSKSSNGYAVSTGVYIYQIKAGKFVTQEKMVLLK